MVSRAAPSITAQDRTQCIDQGLDRVPSKPNSAASTRAEGLRAAGLGFSTGMDSNEKRPTGKGSRTRPVTLAEPVLVPITAEQERRAVEALAELPARLFLEERVTRAEAEQ